MLASICILSFAIFIKSLADPFYVDELEKLLDDKTDKWDVEELKNNDDMTRFVPL